MFKNTEKHFHIKISGDLRCNAVAVGPLLRMCAQREFRLLSGSAGWLWFGAVALLWALKTQKSRVQSQFWLQIRTQRVESNWHEFFGCISINIWDIIHVSLNLSPNFWNSKLWALKSPQCRNQSQNGFQIRTQGVEINRHEFFGHVWIKFFVPQNVKNRNFEGE